MAFQYQQTTGTMTDADGNLVGTGYSGNGVWKNNPIWQEVKDHGPIPQGVYAIGHALFSQKLGPVVMALIPSAANAMFGRDSFFIHGDNGKLNGSASDGCIVLAHNVRVAISISRDKTLVVVA